MAASGGFDQKTWPVLRSTDELTAVIGIQTGENEGRAYMGRPSSYRLEFAKMARRLCKLGATDADLADAFGVSIQTIGAWKAKHPDFPTPQKGGKTEADDRAKRSLYQRAVGYSYDAVKIFCDKNGRVTRVPYVEHVQPDVTALVFWLKNSRWESTKKNLFSRLRVRAQRTSGLPRAIVRWPSCPKRRSGSEKYYRSKSMRGEWGSQWRACFQACAEGLGS
jgi:hypothetical protein